MDASDTHKQNLIALATEVRVVLQKILSRTNANKSENAQNGNYQFAYAEYYLVEVSNLVDFSIFLMSHDTFRKYVHFPTRLIMEIVLEMEHVYSVRTKKGANAVQRLFFKDIAIAAKSTLAKPGEGSKEIIRNHLGFLDIASKLLKLDFDTSNVSEKSNRQIKSLCDKSQIVVKEWTGSQLYSFYEILSEHSHANVVNVGASSSLNDKVGSIHFFEIAIELAIRLGEIIVKESNFRELEGDIQNLKRIGGIK
jgi:hypothetical protein